MADNKSKPVDDASNDNCFANGRSQYWRWLVSGLLLLATMINYMDRQTLSNLSVRITKHFDLLDQQYGNLETVFGVSFAIGSIVFGLLADRLSVRLLYPIVLVGWSAVGFITGLSQGYESLLVCRGLLGFFESGHWPCALIVTQSILSRGDRAMGNSLLQSGAAIGAIVTPQIIGFMVLGNDNPNAWRMPFYVIGAVGIFWVVGWLATIGKDDLPTPSSRTQETEKQLGGRMWLSYLMADRRFWALVVMIITINASWQLVRAWLPKFLQQGRDYAEADALNFNSLFYIATDLGCILAGAFALLLVKKGLKVHTSRFIVYFICCILAALTCVAVSLPASRLMLALLLLVGAGLLGLFPCFYTFSQEVPKAIMGRMAGLLSCVGWLASAPTHSLFGAVIDRTKSYDLVLAMVGFSPMIGLMFFWLLWPKPTIVDTTETNDP
ncbi:MAG: MFS transporter [Pirellulales bacterium]